jgi:hypothetical protein
MKISYTSHPVFSKRSLALAYEVLSQENPKAYRFFEGMDECIYLYDRCMTIYGINESELKNLSWPVVETFVLDDTNIYRFEINGVSYWTCNTPSDI